MGRKRKLHLGQTPIGGGVVKSRRVAREVTSQYHIIQNEKSTVAKRTDLTTEAKELKLGELDERMKTMGGTNRYQQASIISTQHFKTSRWVASTLDNLGMIPAETKPQKKDNADSKALIGKQNQKLQVLEVGAINAQLQQYSWMQVKAIDLNSQHPYIEECDFLKLKPNADYDAVVCSMVLNCVDDAERRGEMLARLSAQLKPNRGILLLVLPSRCIRSKHLGSLDLFYELLNGFGLQEVVPLKLTPKLTFFVLQRRTLNVSKLSDVSDGEEVVVDASTCSSTIAGKRKSKKLTGSDNSTSSASAHSELNRAPLSSCGLPNDSVALTTDAMWRRETALFLHSSITHRARSQYTRDYASVPPNEFCISIPPDLLR